MKLISLFAVLGAGVLCAQTPAPPPPPANEPSPETVVASYNGKKLTYGELRKFISVLPAAQQQAAWRDRKTLVHEYFLMQQLAEMAEKEKLDEKSPMKEQLEYNRRFLLMNAKLNWVANTITVSEEDVQKTYEANKDKYSQVKLKMLYISFSNNPEGAGGKKVLSEDEAKAKIEKILAGIRAGADFVKMVKEHSEDASSAQKDGDFGVIRKSDNVPDAIRSAIFGLKPGEVSAPVRQPNGFYLFRAEAVTIRSFKEVEVEVGEQARQAKYQQWLAQMNANVDFKVENDQFFTAPAPASAAAPAGSAR
jgi:parvulin-like peptidyl-prolyl isomerase